MDFSQSCPKLDFSQNLRKRLFTFGAYNNIDHNPSSTIFQMSGLWFNLWLQYQRPLVAKLKRIYFAKLREHVPISLFMGMGVYPIIRKNKCAFYDGAMKFRTNHL